MNFFKRYWYVLLLGIITVGLAVMVFLTSQQLSKKTPVAPTVPEVAPQAVAPACTLTFALSSPTPTHTGTPTPTATATPSLTPTLTPTNTPTPTITPTSSPGPSPTPISQCNAICASDSECPSNLTCSDGACRNSSCTDEVDCSCTPPVTQGTPPAQSTPKVPVSGIGPGAVGISVITIGSLLVLLGLAL